MREYYCEGGGSETIPPRALMEFTVEALAGSVLAVEESLPSDIFSIIQGEVASYAVLKTRMRIL